MSNSLKISDSLERGLMHGDAGWLRLAAGENAPRGKSALLPVLAAAAATLFLLVVTYA